MDNGNLEVDLEKMLEKASFLQSDEELVFKSYLDRCVGIPLNFNLKDLPPLRDDTVLMIFHLTEYLFHKSPNGFYMFYEPHPELPHYSKGESWSERLWDTANNFKLKFDKIGVRYDSYQEFADSKEKFGKLNKKYYCSIYNKSRKQAYYIRNNEIVDKAVKSVLGDLTVADIFENSFKENILALEETLKVIKEKKQHETLSTQEMIRVHIKSF